MSAPVVYNEYCAMTVAPESRCNYWTMQQLPDGTYDQLCSGSRDVRCSDMPMLPALRDPPPLQVPSTQGGMINGMWVNPDPFAGREGRMWRSRASKARYFGDGNGNGTCGGNGYGGEWVWGIGIFVILLLFILLIVGCRNGN